MATTLASAANLRDSSDRYRRLFASELATWAHGNDWPSLTDVYHLNYSGCALLVAASLALDGLSIEEVSRVEGLE